MNYEVTLYNIFYGQLALYNI